MTPRTRNQSRAMAATLAWAIGAAVAPGAAAVCAAAPASHDSSRSRNPIVAAPVDPARAAWAEARALADGGHHDAALAVIHRALAIQPDNIDLRWLEAGVTAWSGRHADAVRLYERLVADHPGLARDVRSDLATERLWAGDSKGALRDFQLRLAEQPGDQAAALAIARIENWSGRHARAIARLTPLAAEPDADPEVLKTLAFAQYWSGDPALAGRWLEAYLTRVPNDREALELRSRLARERGPGVSAGTSRADDSDELRVVSTTAELRLPLGMRTTATLGVQRDNVRDLGGTRDPLRFGAGLETIWSAHWVTRAAASRCDLGRSAGTVGLGELSLVWRPKDGVRLDLGASRDLVMTRIALDRGISVRSQVEGIDWSPVERLVLHADARQRFYSDDNRAQAEALSARWQVHSARTHRLAVLVRGEQLRTRRDLPDGYYDPAQYLEWGPGLEAEWTPRPVFTLSANGRTGWQRERDAERRPFVNASARAEWVIAQVGTLAIEGGRSNSNLQSASGYEQKRWSVSMSRGF